jgi:hypothetical protein
MKMWQVVISFLAGLFAGYKARTAAKAGSELPQGEAAVKATEANVKKIEAELERAASTAAAAAAAGSQPN